MPTKRQEQDAYNPTFFVQVFQQISFCSVFQGIDVGWFQLQNFCTNFYGFCSLLILKRRKENQVHGWSFVLLLQKFGEASGSKNYLGQTVTDPFFGTSSINWDVSLSFHNRVVFVDSIFIPVLITEHTITKCNNHFGLLQFICRC